MSMENSMDEDSLRPPERSRGDATHAGIKAALSMIPVAGELFEAIISPPLSRRQDAWMKVVAEGLLLLQEKVESFDPANLKNNEPFVTTVLEATAAAMRTHQKEKLEALRNVVLNAAMLNPAEEDLQLLFVHWISRLTTWHLHILGVLGRSEYGVDGRLKPHLSRSVDRTFFEQSIREIDVEV